MNIEHYAVKLARQDRPDTAPIASWGRDGWDLGDWPYVKISHGQMPAGFVVECYVEGDRSFYVTPDTATRDRVTDYLAWFYWTNREELDCAFEDMPAERCGPFSWARLDAERDAGGVRL